MACEFDILYVLGQVIPDDVYFVVPASGGQYGNNGDISFVVPAFIGWETRMFRNGWPQFLGNPNNGDTYFDYTGITGEFTLSIPLVTGEVIICQPYKPS